MGETLEQVQHQAYVKGWQMKLLHRQQHCVLTTEVAVTTLSADFAQVSLVTFLRQPSIIDAHLCVLAFHRGYTERYAQRHEAVFISGKVTILL